MKTGKKLGQVGKNLSKNVIFRNKNNIIEKTGKILTLEILLCWSVS